MERALLGVVELEEEGADDDAQRQRAQHLLQELLGAAPVGQEAALDHLRELDHVVAGVAMQQALLDLLPPALLLLVPMLLPHITTQQHNN